MQTYNPYAIKRTVRFDKCLGNTLVFKSKSFTQDDPENKYIQTVNLATGKVYCPCSDFRYRKSGFRPTLHSPQGHLCKHLNRIVNNLRKKRVIQ